MENRGPLLCDPSEKAQLEGANGLAQVEYIDELISREVHDLRESHVRELHRLAVEGIYPCGAKYRDARMQVRIQNSPHEIPAPAFVPALVVEAIEWINHQKGQLSPLDRAAYALWRFNWIHPFSGGNGRTSRGIAYLIICMDNNAMLPGKPNMPTLIYDNRDEYIVAFRAVDAAEAAGKTDLSAMSGFLRRMLTMQLACAIDRLSSPPSNPTVNDAPSPPSH
jgi:Fic family protein